ncbi:hypothetical protein I3F58_17170 [Streptomyces sp. MUM 203J]|uniref:hypothetical protein n=1 Tax=Streptomyces sp. MUM 203J TaxID=2791990 RepID=UPI001F03D022|nr:hypothetical protein [Streptomyces sp. MUM 203J]MCH0541266.1 hypothetical protein [Streptomyces sp. MUM 203J]
MSARRTVTAYTLDRGPAAEPERCRGHGREAPQPHRVRTSADTGAPEGGDR